MAGSIIIIVVLLVMPIFILMSTMVLAGVIGWLVNDDVDANFEGHELLELANTGSAVGAEHT
ncbi:MAG: hypothetical protein OEU32_03780 [Acidimicrobiia bacterium]|nr:hypothetical protein [Acidimicrobiia bacterium]